jgi:methylphosphotriester-DNA--protein-cysteine methyltransferase
LGTELAPKQFFRIHRLSSVVRRLAHGGAKLADLTASAGYEDQAQLTRAFPRARRRGATSFSPRSADSSRHHVRE